MPTEVQFRRGSTAQNNSFTGAAGELSVNITNNSVRVHDGSTAGGFELAKADLSNTTGLGTVSAANVGIGSTIVISAGFELKNIQSLDATTTATIESAIAAAPNNFTSLNVTGIGTVIGTFNVGTGGTVLTALSQAGISSVGINSTVPTATLDVTGTAKVSTMVTVGSAVTITSGGIVAGLSTITNFNATHINSTGIGTFATAIVGSAVTITSGGIVAGLSTITNFNATHINSTGIGTFATAIVGSAVTITSGGIVAGLSTITNFNATHINATGITTALRFSGELVGAAVTTVGGLHQNTGIATITQVVGNLTGSVNSGFTTVTNTLKVTGITTLSGPVAVSGVSTFFDNARFIDNVKVLLGDGGDLEIYHDGNNSYIADVGGGSLQFNASPDIRFLNSSSGISTIASGGLDITGGIALGITGIITAPQVKIGAGVTISSHGIDVSNGTHIGATGIATIQQIIVGAAVTATASGLDSLNVKVGTALTVVGISTFNGQVNVGVNTSIGVILTAANGTRYRLFVENNGSLNTIALA